jgi:hypothetical protein
MTSSNRVLTFRAWLRTLQRVLALLFLLALSAGAWFRLCAEETVQSPPPLAIANLVMQGTNLVLTALVPAGLATVALDTRPNLETPWEQFEQRSASADGGEMTFIFPQTEEVSRFFRLRASPVVKPPQVLKPSQIASQIVKPAPLVSSEMEFVPIASLGSHLSNGNAMFHFKGRVDGSDKILITHDGALWEHVNWRYPPESVEVNDTKWNPAQKNYMSSFGAMKFLPESFSLESADLSVIKGRDVVSLEQTPKGLIVYLDDTPSAASEYEFNVTFPPAVPKLEEPHASIAAHLKISALVSGSDIIKITSKEAVLKHKSFQLPSDVIVNEIPWDVRQNKVLKNAGATQFLPEGVDFSTARIVSRKGRDLATSWGTKDTLWVHFADNPNGSDMYEIEIAFGPNVTQR